MKSERKRQPRRRRSQPKKPPLLSVLSFSFPAVLLPDPAGAEKVVRALRRNPNWRIVDVQSTRVQMNAVWEAVFAQGEDLATIYRRRLIATLRQNGVTVFYTEEAAAFAELGFEAAVNPYAE